jgi:hypothetical protein
MNLVNILQIIQIILLVCGILLALIYSIPVLLIPRFHNVNNLFTVNLCFATIFCCSYWLLFYIILAYSPRILYGNQSCIAFNYFQMMCTIQVPLAVVEVSVHRLCTIVYYEKPFFKKRRWAVICISCQWIIGILSAIPQISFNDSVRNTNRFFESKNTFL